MIKELTMEKSINLEDWEIFKFGEICKFVRGPFGGSLKKSIFKESGFAVYEQKHAIYDRFDNVRYFVDEEKFNEMKRFELNSGDLIMSCSGTIGKIAIVPDNIQRGIINQALLILSPNKKVSNIYLKLWLQSENFQDSLKKYTKGAAIKNVASVKILKNIEIPLPPLLQQKQIVATLDKAFAAIDTAKANAKQNLQNAKELFESYLQNVFENKGDDWEEKTFKELSSRIGDGLHGTPKYDVNGDYYFINGNNLNDGVIEIKENTKKINKEEFEKHKRELTNNTVLISINGTLGKVAFYDDEPVILGKSACYINFNDEVNKHYIKYLVKSPLFFKNMASNSTGATIKNFSLKSMRNYTLPLPSIKEQKKIVNKLDNISAESKKLEAIYTQKIADLEEMKKSVLQKAFSGQLNTIN
jgi:type I restriction enzyme S subunit